MNQPKKLTKEQAETIAADLIASEPRFNDSVVARAIPVLKKLTENNRMLRDDFTFYGSSITRRYTVFKIP